MSDVLDRLAADASEKARTITVTFYRHNVRTDHGKTYIWNMSRQFKTWDQLMRTLAADIHGVTGPSQKVYDLHGNKLTELSQLEHGGVYICCGGEAFTTAGIPPKASGEAPDARFHATEDSGDGADSAVKTISKETADRMITDDINKNKTKEVWFYGANGQAHKTDRGTRMIINPTKYRTVEQLMGELRGKIVLVTGSIQKLYDFEGHELQSIADLQDKGRYVCSINRGFAASMIPTYLSE